MKKNKLLVHTTTWMNFKNNYAEQEKQYKIVYTA